MSVQHWEQTAPDHIVEVRESGALELRGVVKRFGDVVAVAGVDLTIPAGAFFSLLGPSGCGKTTVLRILAGLETLDKGQIVLDDRDITRAAPEKRPFNTVFQRYALFPHLNVHDNIAFGLTTSRRRRPSAHEIELRVQQMLELVGLSAFGDRLPSQLSGGQAQRVAVARALIRRPDVLLLDEPLSALDRNVRHALREELLHIHRELGTTFLLVTHDQDEALSLSQSIALMNHGKVEQVADPQTLYHRPATAFAARFIGAGTFVEAHVLARRSGQVQVEVAGHCFAAIDCGVGDALTASVLLRPEDLEIGSPDGGAICGRVETCAFFGSEFQLTVETSVGLVRARTPNPVAPGTPIGISWPASAGLAYKLES